MVWNTNIRENFDLEIKLGYEAGISVGCNVSRRGYFLYFTKVERNGQFVKYVPRETVNFKVSLRETKRKSSRTYDTLLKRVEKVIPQLQDAYINKTKDDVLKIIKGINNENN